MRNIVIGIIVVVVIIVGFLFFRSFSQTPSVPVVQKQPTTTSATPSTGAGEESESSTTITYTSSGFSPSDVTIKSGGSVTWMNDGDREIQIAANPHPVHTGNKEVSGGGFVLTLQPGEQATVTMNEVGSHGYHNHLNSSQGGTITIE